MEQRVYLFLIFLAVIIVGWYIHYLQIQNNDIRRLLYQSMTKRDTTDNRLPTEWNTRTKSFDSERALTRDYKFMAIPDKCFDCTNQVARNLGTEYAIYEQPTKLFSMGSL
jgi:hypothetical protein